MDVNIFPPVYAAPPDSIDSDARCAICGMFAAKHRTGQRRFDLPADRPGDLCDTDMG